MSHTLCGMQKSCFGKCARNTPGSVPQIILPANWAARPAAAPHLLSLSR